MKWGTIEIIERKDVGIARGRGPLLVRWKLLAFGSVGLYLHHFLRSDYDRSLHDHPWTFISMIVKGGYYEEHQGVRLRKKRMVWHGPGSLLYRPARWRHRVIVVDGIQPWTLVLVGPRVRRWGFHTPKGWCWWRQFNPEKNICEDKPYLQGGGD